jgi:response regulator RpfG family c-di-GMP phosphodiesterase
MTETVRLLLVDNDDEYLVTCSIFFNNAGYQVFTAGSPDEAKEKLWQHQVHLVLVDWRLTNDHDAKDNSGFIFAQTTALAIPKIILTRFPHWKNVARAMRPSLYHKLPPAVDFVDKAEGLHKLHQAIERQLVKYPPHPLDLSQLRIQMEAYFNEDELHELCFDLRSSLQVKGYVFDLDYENLPGSTKKRKIIYLIEHFERRQLMLALIMACYRQRPHVRWW